MARAQTVDLSSIADRVHPQTWSLFQALRTRMRQLKGVTMKLDYEKQSQEAVPAFYYGSRRLFHIRARGEEINATFHADYKAKNRLAENQTLDWRLRNQVSKKSWTDFSLRSSKDLAPFVELVRAKYDLINEDVTGKLAEERPIAV